MSVPRERRFTRDHPCPICGGHRSQTRRKGQRCYGFLSADACYAHCTREEFAGGLDADAAGTYAHRLNGSCRCGATHGVAPPPPPPRAARVFFEDHFKDCEAGSPWDYVNEAGRILYRKARHPGKRFAFYHRDSNGAWTDGRGTDRSVVLDLPHVRAAVDAGRTLYLTEGEMKARMLRDLGLDATTNATGALGFSDKDAECFRGAAIVVVVLDNDSEGRKRGVRVPPLLHAAGVNEIRMLLIPGLAEGEGVDDWIAARREQDPEVVRSELVTLADAAPPWKRPAAATEAIGSARITRMSDVQTRRLSWLWQHRIPRGMVTVLGGQGGLGKSTVLLDIAARVTTGRSMPDGDPGLREPASVVIFTAEDALDSVVVPRLLLAGADLTRIVTVSVKVGEGEDRSLMVTPADLARLESVVRAEGAKLLIFDPIVSYVGADVNMHHAQDARRILAWLHRLAERLDIAVVGIHHWNKSQSADPTMRLSGSAAIGQAARSVLAIGPDPDDTTGERMILALDKRNLAPRDTPSLAFQLAAAPGDEHPHVEWLGTSTVTSRDLAAEPQDPEQRAERQDAEAWLRDLLADHREVLAKDGEAEARARGISDRTLDRARRRVGVEAYRERVPGKGSLGPWRWRLPSQGVASWRSGVLGSESSARGNELGAPSLNATTPQRQKDGEVQGVAKSPTPSHTRRDIDTCGECGTALTEDDFGFLCNACVGRAPAAGLELPNDDVPPPPELPEQGAPR